MDKRLELQVLNLSFLGRLRVSVLLNCVHGCLCLYVHKLQARADAGRERVGGGRERGRGNVGKGNICLSFNHSRDGRM